MGISNPSTYLSDRLAALRKAQNPDGGWSFYTGKKASWVEPTVYAALALHDQPEADRAWDLIRGWQLSSGGWRPAADVPVANWTTALAVLLASRRSGQASAVPQGKAVVQGIEWLRNNAKDGAWSWRRGNLAAAEPTALALLALRAAGSEEGLNQGAEAFLLADTLTPETCGPALIGLQGTQQVRGLIPVATQWAEETCSPYTRAWIRIGLRVNGVNLGVGPTLVIPQNLTVLALEALAAPDGNHHLFKAEGTA